LDNNQQPEEQAKAQQQQMDTSTKLHVQDTTQIMPKVDRT
jgi:hypothetical protein